MSENNTAEKKAGNPRPATGFANLLDEMVRSICTTDTLARVIRKVLTLKQRQPYSIALRGLTARQKALLDLMGKALCQWTPPPADSLDAVWQIGVWDHGRIFLSDAVVDSENCTVFAWLKVPAEISRQIDARARQAELERAKSEHELETFLAGVTEAQKRKIVELVRDGIDHTDPVLIYVNDRTFTNFGSYNNLLRKPGALLERLAEIPIADWLADEKRFVICFYWIRRIGMRGEEFNGLQLTPYTLHAYFDDCFQRYCQLLGAQPEEWPESLEDKANRLSQMRQEISRDHILCRWVNGLTFFKAERFVQRSIIRQSPDNLPTGLRDYIESVYGLQVSSFANFDELFRACVEACTDPEKESGSPLMDGVEQLLERITSSAIEAINSDIGMTRGIRDIRRWQEKLDAQRFVEISEWPTTDYFCGVFPSAGMRGRMPDPGRLAKVLTACSVRMQYNSWHYMPGHFSKELAPHHFYLPPRMPDTAIWSDQHHAGHVMAAVRFSIRSPASLKYRERTYFGMVDLRLFRTIGARYTRKDLCEAMKYTEYLRAVYQAITDMAAAGERHIVIRAFDKPWFERYCSTLFDNSSVLQTQATGAA
ncbi:MAG TPA: hypothetical protein VI636_16645 [Candidatus Angelobacter sp.]